MEFLGTVLWVVLVMATVLLLGRWLFQAMAQEKKSALNRLINKTGESQALTFTQHTIGQDGGAMAVDLEAQKTLPDPYIKKPSARAVVSGAES